MIVTLMFVWASLTVTPNGPIFNTADNYSISRVDNRISFILE